MFERLKLWYENRFSDPQIATLFITLLLGFFTIYWLSGILAPVFVAIVFAYLLEWPVMKLTRLGLSRTLSTTIIIIGFIGLMTLVMMWIIPIVWYQGRGLISDLPRMIEQGKILLLELPEMMPGIVSEEQIIAIMQAVDQRLMLFARDILSLSLASIVDLVAVVVYLILVPLMVFFMLKDKKELISSFSEMLPTERKLVTQVWHEMNTQIMNYIRGKILEILIVGIVSYTIFRLFGLNYSLLLGVLVGFSVLIPYIGTAVVTLPVAFVAFFQWGFSAEFGYLMLAYGIMQALDGNLLAPLLLSEVVDLNPVYIIVAILFFGGLFGFWGIFFSIPLASLVKAIISAWLARLRAVNTAG